MSFHKANFFLVFIVAISGATIAIDKKGGGRSMPWNPILPHSKPWLVALNYPDSGWFPGGSYCTGALIGKDSVLTAAHCCPCTRAAVGAHDLKDWAPNEWKKIIDFVEYRFPKNHPMRQNSPIEEENGCFFDLDVAIARLQEPIAFWGNSRVQQAKLASPGTDCFEIVLQVAGWGLTGDRGTEDTSTPNGLRMKCVGFSSCLSKEDPSDVFTKYPGLAEFYTCAESINKKDSDVCGGDSGGPLEFAGVIYAIVSRGDACKHKSHTGKEKRPGIYANVRSGAIHDFIIDAVSDVIIE